MEKNIVDSITNSANFGNGVEVTKKQVLVVLRELAEYSNKHLTSGSSVMLPGIGKLEVVHRAERQGRNPRTGEVITIVSKNAVKFKPAKKLKDAVNR